MCELEEAKQTNERERILSSRIFGHCPGLSGTMLLAKSVGMLQPRTYAK